MPKKVICLLVDSLMPKFIDDGLEKNILSGLRYLIENGTYSKECVTVFPTMTASIDASLITGVYPDEHKVPGLIWYNRAEKKIVNYINGFKCIWKLGIKNCAENVLVHFNEDHISSSVTTIFEELADQNISSASINLIAHRGKTKHKLHIPKTIKWAAKWNTQTVIHGPEIMTMGKFAQPEWAEQSQEKDSSSSMFMRCGINDPYAINMLIKLIQNDKQPPFSMVYLPDLDHEVHIHGPSRSENALIQVDQHIQRVLNAFPSWEQALKENIFVIISDHGQTEIGTDKNTYNIDLDQLFQGFRSLQLGEDLQPDHELVICNNERMAYLYPLKEGVLEKVYQTLKMENRIDLMAWKEEHSVRVTQPGSERTLYFRKGGTFVDEYGEEWEIKGSEEVLDLQVNQNLIQFGQYPDVLSRLYGALYSQDYPVIVVTARPRFELKSRYYPTHNGGGSHGSLHIVDSMIPFIISEKIPQSAVPRRLVELKSFFIRLLQEQKQHKSC